MVRKLFIFTILTCFTLSGMAQEVISARSKPIFISTGGASTVTAKPVLTWLNPAENVTEIEQTTASVKVGINATNDVKSATIFVNNVPDLSRGFGLTKKSEAGFDQVFEKEITLEEGENMVKLVVEDQRGNVVEEYKTIISTPPTLAQRNDYALVIGTNEYETWSDLTNPVYDATTISKELEESYGYQTELITNPTKKEFLSKLREYAKKSYGENDQLFIFVAGHGQFDDFFQQGYLVMRDSDIADEEKISYVSHANLRSIVDNIPCKHIFLMMDACFGGTFDPTIARAGSRGGGMYGGISNQEFIERKLRYKTRQYMTSGGKEYVPDGRPGSHSPFASKFLSALRNYGGENGIVTIDEIKIEVELLEPEPRMGPFGQNQPGSDFLFVAQQ